MLLRRTLTRGSPDIPAMCIECTLFEKPPFPQINLKSQLATIQENGVKLSKKLPHLTA